MLGDSMNGSHHNFDQPGHSSSKAAGRPGVIIVSNVLLYREGLAASVSRDGRLEVIAALGAADAFEALSDFSPDAVLLDASMDEGLAMARSLRANWPNLRAGRLRRRGRGEQLHRLRGIGARCLRRSQWLGERARDRGPGRAARGAEMLAPGHRDDLRPAGLAGRERGTKASSR